MNVYSDKQRFVLANAPHLMKLIKNHYLDRFFVAQNCLFTLTTDNNRLHAALDLKATEVIRPTYKSEELKKLSWCENSKFILYVDTWFCKRKSRNICKAN